MARRTARPEATQEKILTPLKGSCEDCGQPLWVANHSHRTVTLQIMGKVVDAIPIFRAKPLLLKSYEAS